ncbi:PfkB family carbohydrate kinase [Rhizobium johnstonii]|uniref:PfkB family carbohydrate kinase n=1 Tax=Rhizobium TaxID=379 RepID=UPI002E0ED6A8|nr:PfkB family carbohydrate kinase [Rhizobium beringeri]
MSEIQIVGGVYREKVAFPYWDQLFGSAGRAAMALVGQVDTVRLRSAVTSHEKITATAIFAAVGIDLHLRDRPLPIEFDYIHTLAIPAISPGPVRPPIDLPGTVGEVVIKFGMLESDPSVTGKYVVFDPQAPQSPRSFASSGSSADHLAVIANRGEILRMANANTVEDAVGIIISREKAEVVVVKDGIDGATVYAAGQSHHIPAFKTRNVFSLGSGDVFVAAFALAWAVRKNSPAEAALFASRSVANYVETQALPILPPNELVERDVAKKAGGKIYLAGPFRETGQRMFIEDARTQLKSLGMEVFSPIHDIGPGVAEVVVKQDLSAVHQCDAVFAILNGSSPGTVFEVGYARALGKPVFCVTQNMREVDVKLPKGSGAFLHDDYVSALFQIAWRS